MPPKRQINHKLPYSAPPKAPPLPGTRLYSALPKTTAPVNRKTPPPSRTFFNNITNGDPQRRLKKTNSVNPTTPPLPGTQPYSAPPQAPPLPGTQPYSAPPQAPPLPGTQPYSAPPKTTVPVNRKTPPQTGNPSRTFFNNITNGDPQRRLKKTNSVNRKTPPQTGNPSRTFFNNITNGDPQRRLKKTNSVNRNTTPQTGNPSRTFFNNITNGDPQRRLKKTNSVNRNTTPQTGNPQNKHNISSLLKKRRTAIANNNNLSNNNWFNNEEQRQVEMLPSTRNVPNSSPPLPGTRPSSAPPKTTAPVNRKPPPQTGNPSRTFFNNITNGDPQKKLKKTNLVNRNTTPQNKPNLHTLISSRLPTKRSAKANTNNWSNNEEQRQVEMLPSTRNVPNSSPSSNTKTSRWKQLAPTVKEMAKTTILAEKGKGPVNNARLKNRNVQNQSQSSKTKTSAWQKLREPEFTSAIKELAKTAILVENPGNRSLNNKKTQIEKANNLNYVWNKGQKRLKRNIIGEENINFPNSPWPLVPIGTHLNKSQQMSVLLKMNEVANKFAKNDAYVLIENLKGLGPTLILKSLINNKSSTKVQANNKQSMNFGTDPANTPTLRTGTGTNKQSTNNSPVPELGNNKNKQSMNSGTAPVRTPPMNSGTAPARTPPMRSGTAPVNTPTLRTGTGTNKQSTNNSPFPELGNNKNKQSMNSGTAPVRTPPMNYGTASANTPTLDTGTGTNKQSTNNSPFPELGNNKNVITTNGTVSKKIKNINSKECERLRMELKDKYIEYRRQCNKNLPQNFDTLFGK